jgi:hypothetical protein
MSTGENFNADGQPVTADILRKGFQRFPSSTIVHMSPSMYAQIAPLLITKEYPWKSVADVDVPITEIWFMDGQLRLLGRVVNLKAAPGGGPHDMR